VDAYLIDAVRTPFGKHAGGLSHIRTDDLAALPIARLIERNPHLDPADIEDVILGDTNGAGEDNRNVARMAALLAGLPESVPGVTVNRLCASGAEAIVQAGRMVRSGEATQVIAGGVESMSRAPFILPRPDRAFPRSLDLTPTQVGWRLINPKMNAEWVKPLGECAQRVAEELGIDRGRQDEWAARSHELAEAAWRDGVFADRVMPVEDCVKDESIRPSTTAATLAGLRSAFTADGAITAGNSSPINDGAAAVLVSSRPEPHAMGRLVASATVGVAPERFSLGPVDAINKVLARAELEFDDIAAWEINEAFSAMVLSCLHRLPKIPEEKVNRQGGAIAYGHPLGASAPRIIMDLCDQLRRRGGGYGIAAACIGVGQGMAVVVHVD